MRKTNIRQSKFADSGLLIETVITEIIESNKEYAEKIKNVFKCESRSGEAQLCILWGHSSISVGDRVQMRGRMKDDVFLAWSLNILKKGE